MSNAIERFADKAMFEAAPVLKDEGGVVEPKVFLLWMTPDPLGAIAAMCRMYEGTPTYNLADITNSERKNYLGQVQKTHLKAPLEAVKMHFFIEGVDRSFTHQMVRQRTAVYSQESMRFAVKRGMVDEALTPPSIATAGNDIQDKWAETMTRIQETYDYLIANGIPAEDARGLLPHVTSTRLNYVTDLRALSDHAGNRLCTQAQFLWRKVFNEIVKSISEYDPHPGSQTKDLETGVWLDDTWQFKGLAASPLFRPVCYQLGRCPFNADFDRGCTIRERVDRNAGIGRPSNLWHTEALGDEPSEDVPPIHPAEWMLDPRAAWVR